MTYMSILSAVNDFPASTVREIKQIAGGVGCAVLDTAVKRRMHSAGLTSRRVVQKPIVSAANKEGRLMFGT